MPAILTTKRTIESKVHPGCSFTVRTLNTIQRARRDSTVSAARLTYTQAHAELETLRKSYIGEGGSAEERIERYKALKPEQRVRLDDLMDQERRIYEEKILPAEVKAALLSIIGLEIDGEAITTAEAFLETAPDELLAEVHDQCINSSGLTEEETKN